MLKKDAVQYVSIDIQNQIPVKDFPFYLFPKNLNKSIKFSISFVCISGRIIRNC